MMTETTETVTNIFKQATETFQNAMQTGARFQQEAFKNFVQPLTSTDNFEDFRTRTKKMSDATIKFAQKNFDESQRLLDTQYRTGMDLLKKTFETTKPAENHELFEATRTLWEDSFQAMKSTIEQFNKTNSQVVENITQFVAVPFAGERKSPAAKA